MVITTIKFLEDHYEKDEAKYVWTQLEIQGLSYSENTYVIDGKTYNVTSHFVGNKDIAEVIYRLAFKRAFYETTGYHISDEEIKK